MFQYFFTKWRLRLAKRRTSAAKRDMEETITHTKAAMTDIERSYTHFLDCSRKQEQLAVKLKRLQNRQPDRPILKVHIDTGRVDTTADADAALTKLDVELALAHHRQGDWGNADTDQWLYNNAAALRGSGVVRSKYGCFGGRNFFVDTDIRNKQTMIHLEACA